MLELYREKVKGTTIDPSTLLSTDYFNHFNEVIMLLGILPEMPEIMDEIDGWNFKTYEQHFEGSGLAFAGLAIEAYAHVPPTTREQFDQTIDMMRMTVEDARTDLRDTIASGNMEKLAILAADYAKQLQDFVEMGSTVIHGSGASLDQSAIDALF
ncbi:MAG TPA: hypothetical protein VL574_01235 [Stellaceae bacterium]|jgi:hypothetical protein|nr:hypothetical protein [Stellaceae bacterium]